MADNSEAPVMQNQDVIQGARAIRSNPALFAAPMSPSTALQQAPTRPPDCPSITILEASSAARAPASGLRPRTPVRSLLRLARLQRPLCRPFAPRTLMRSPP